MKYQQIEKYKDKKETISPKKELKIGDFSNLSGQSTHATADRFKIRSSENLPFASFRSGVPRFSETLSHQSECKLGPGSYAVQDDLEWQLEKQFTKSMQATINRGFGNSAAIKISKLIDIKKLKEKQQPTFKKLNKTYS